MEDEDQRREEILAVLRKFGIAVVGIAVLIFVGSKVFVNFFDLSTNDTGPTYSNGTPEPTELPTVAITPTKSPAGGATDEPTDVPTDYPTNIVTPSPGNGDLFLSASPVFVNAMERINLTGQWPGKDNVSLLVQRFENGEWVDFGVQVNIQVGTFETYVMTGREGDNKFRVYDPETGTASNEVTVTIGG